MKAIGTVELTARDGEKFWVDEEDLDVVGDYVWRVEKRGGYAVGGRWSREGTHMRKRNGTTILKGKAITVKLHKEIMKKHGFLKPGLMVDHKNGNRLDNTKANLRMVTPAQNALNKLTSGRNKSGLMGVFMSNDVKRKKRWVAIVVGKRKRFYTFEEAAAWREVEHQEVLLKCGL